MFVFVDSEFIVNMLVWIVNPYNFGGIDERHRITH